jgi:phage shock protein PspC (stress-responsive transcriptional regulator)
MDDDGREPEANPTDASPPGPVTTEMPPPSVPDAPARRPLRRSASDKVIAGVAGGLAETFGVSSLAVRSLFGLAFVVVAFEVWTLLGVAVVAYVLLWIFVPREDIGVSPAGRLTRRFPRIGPAIGVLLLLVGAAVIAAQLDGWLVWPVLLIGGGVLLYRYDAGPGAPRTAPSAPGVTPPAALAPTSVEPSPEPRTPRPPRERSPLGWLGLGIALLAVGVAAILQNLGALDIRLVRYPAIALLILGVTILVGAFAGRARWLVLPAILVVPFVLLASVVTVPLEGGFGNLYETPRSAAAVHGSYQRVAGDIFLDLTALAGTPGAPVGVNASTGFGTINVMVPFDAYVVVTGRAGAGSVHAGRLVSDTGFDATLSTTMEPGRGEGATITLDLETGLGDIWVYRLAPTRKQLHALEVER